MIYVFQVEDKMYTCDMETDDLIKGISERNTSHNVCYSILEKFRAVAVIIKTKRKFSLNAVVQLIGYFYQLLTDTRKPGVAVLLTQTTVKFVLFPFYLEGSLANGICLKELSIEQLELTSNVVGLVTSAQYYSNLLKIPLANCFFPIRKSFELSVFYLLPVHPSD